MNDLTIYNQLAAQDAMQAIKELGKFIAQSGLLGVKSDAQGTIMAMACFTERKSPLELASKYHFLEGKLSMRTDYMLSRFYEREGRVKFITDTDTECEMVFINKAFPEGYTVKHTIEELKAKGIAVAKNGNLKDNYKRHPANMLRARCVSDGLRVVDPTINCGAYTPEEVSDFEDKPPQPQGNRPDLAQALTEQQQPQSEPQPAATEAQAEVVDDVADRFAKMLHEHNAGEQFEAWLRERNSISVDQTWEDAPRMILENAVNNPKGFFRVIGVNQ